MIRPIALLATALLCVRAPGQTPAAFDAVSVKPSGSNVFVSYGPSQPQTIGAPFRYSGQRVTCDVSLRAIIQEAFSIAEDYRITGPSWIANERYQISAVMPAGATKDMAPAMLRTMLEERFGLRSHREKKELPAYALIEAKGGFKLRPVDPAAAKERVIDTPMGPRRGVSSAQGPGRFTATAMSLADFANLFLSHQMDAPVMDMTGIQDVYAIDLRWERDPELRTTNGPLRNDPELLRAIERELGLKLEKRKLPLDILVIDEVKKTPTDN